MIVQSLEKKAIQHQMVKFKDLAANQKILEDNFQKLAIAKLKGNFTILLENQY